MKNRVWIVGGSSGIGLELVKLLIEKDYLLIVSSRSATTNQELLILKNKFKEKIYLIDFDVNKNDLKYEIEKVWTIFNGLDIWFYNAASYEVMDIKSWDQDKFIEMNNTNYLGVVKIMCHLSKLFLDQGHGKWIWNLSLSSIFGLPKGGAYSAPKAALLNLAQSIEPELKINNINLQVINHGFVKTRLTQKNSFDMPQLMNPKDVAVKIEKNMFKDNFEVTFPKALTLFLKFLAILPYKISLNITKKTL